MKKNADTKLLWITGCVVVVLLAIAAWLAYSYNPLIKDEEIIAHFNEHRPDIEELVRRYREYVPPEDKDHGTNWNRSPEVKEMMKRAGVERLEGEGSIWMPNPYSSETAKQIDYLVRHARERGFNIFTRYGNIKIELSPSNAYENELFFSRAWIWKDIYYYPEVPRVEKGRLWKPPDVDGTVKEGDRVFTSLDNFPPDWKRAECVFRRIDAQWFVRMCRGAM